MKLCLKCKEDKPLSEFFRAKRNRDGLQRWCKDCFAEAQREYRKANPHKTKGNRPKKQPGKKDYSWVDIEEIKKVEISQKGYCAICKRKRTLVRDHDHTRMKFRGLLCNSCNTGLGYFADDVERLKQAIIYLGLSKPS